MEQQNNHTLPLGSLFDGSGGPLGGILSGITPLWASEIEPFAVRVTTKRLSQMKHYGDVGKRSDTSLRPFRTGGNRVLCTDSSFPFVRYLVT